MEALRRIWHGECITGWLVEEAVHIRAQRIKGALAAIGLDRLVKSLAGLHRDVAVAEEDVVAHETTHGQLSERGLLGDQLGEERLAIVLQIMGVEVVVALAAERGLVLEALAALQHVVDLEAEVVDLREPRGGHHLGEHAGVAAGLREVEDHVLDERAAVDVVVLVGRPLVQQLVVLARGAAAVEGRPALDQLRLLLGVVLLALGILDGTGDVVVVEVVLLDECLPVLVGVQPLGLGELGHGRVLERDPQSPGSVLQYLLRLLHRLRAARLRGVVKLPAGLLLLDGTEVVLLQDVIEQGALLRMEVLQALQRLLVADLALPLCPIDGLRRSALSRDDRRDGRVTSPQKPELLNVGLTESILLQRMPPVASWQHTPDATSHHCGANIREVGWEIKCAQDLQAVNLLQPFSPSAHWERPCLLTWQLLPCWRPACRSSCSCSCSRHR
mmetsp:Transcript_76451/g.248026  ORF Transcript_76451/g.248026 Transcript_76451/m.248026 type:complete len:444 (-) Transcript_76451:1435-2766(-)